MTTPRRRPFVRVLSTVSVGVLLALTPALSAQAAPVVSEVPGGELVSSVTEYDGLLYVGSEGGLQSFDGTTFTTIATVPTGPESPRSFVEYAGDLWMIGGPLTGPVASLWRFDGTTVTEVGPARGRPVVVGGLLYYVAFDPVLDAGYLASTDGTTTTTRPVPADVREVAPGPGGGVALIAGATRTLWTYDGVASTEVVLADAPVDLDGLTTLSGVLVFGGQANVPPAAPGDPTIAHAWDGTAFTQLGATGLAADDVGCFVEYGGALYYGGNDGTTRMFSADVSTAGSEAPVAPTIPSGCPRYVATDGTFYLQAQGTGGGPTLHTWDGTTLTELDSVGDFPREFVEYGGSLYFSAQPIPETPALFVYGEPTAVPPVPTMPNTGSEPSPVAFTVAMLLLAAGFGILIATRRRPTRGRHA